MCPWLPAPFALTTAYSAAVTSERPATMQLIDFLGTPAAMRQFRATGFLPSEIAVRPGAA